MPRVVLGVCGGIAAYKSVELLRLLTEAGHDVTVVPTENALRFVGSATFEALSGKPVSTSVWDGVDRVAHIDIGASAELIVIAPATADFLARATHGVASDLLSNTLLSATAPVLIAPAMHTQMWEHPATAHNVALLRSRGNCVLEPDSGRLTGKDSGVGRLPSPFSIFDAATALLSGTAGLLSGRHVVVTAGGTQESWDAVRFLGNRSSGKQGIAIARAALAAGAQVTLITGSVQEAVPAGVNHVKAPSAAQMLDAVRESMTQQPDALVMTAAVADFRPIDVQEGKIKKDSKSNEIPILNLQQTTDILATVCSERGSASLPVVIGFGAETVQSDEELMSLGVTKLKVKGCEMLVVNNVAHGAIFGEDQSEVIFMDANSHQKHSGTKDHIAQALVARLGSILEGLH